MVVQSIQVCIRRSRGVVQKLISWLPMRKLLGAAAWVLPGFLLAGAALAGQVVPLVMGVVCGLTGKAAVLVSLGGAAGYLLFWGRDAMQPLFWLLAALPCGLLVGPRDITRRTPLLMVSISTLIVAAGGVLFQWLGDDTGVAMYLLRIALGSGATYLVQKAQARDALAKWVLLGMLVLGLARIAPFPWLNFGCIAAGGICAVGAFPAAVLAGLALDLARFSRVSMTAAMCIGWFWQLLGRKPKPLRMAAPAISWVILAMLWGRMDLRAVPGLLLGGAVAMGCGKFITTGPRRGDTGVAQVRLELTARILQETRQQLLEPAPSPPDAAALVEKIRQTLCVNCSAQPECTTVKTLSLHNPDVRCSQPEKLLPELHRAQQQLRQMNADRRRREEYRLALVQQYDFLADYLRSLADLLPRRGDRIQTAYAIRCAARSAGKEPANGDRCLAFPGTGGRYYVLLCDGMGTGLGAAREGDSAAGYLRQRLLIGFPAEHALRSLNSILVLKGKGGAVTMDLAEMDLGTGKATLYKWGASPSWLLKKKGAEKIGTATPPPGLSLSGTREESVQLSLRGGEVLILLSDGVEAGETLRRMEHVREMQPGELAQAVLKAGCSGDDDATVAVICLQKLR